MRSFRTNKNQQDNILRVAGSLHLKNFIKLMLMPPFMLMMAMVAGVLLFVTMKELRYRQAQEVSEGFLHAEL